MRKTWVVGITVPAIDHGLNRSWKLGLKAGALRVRHTRLF